MSTVRERESEGAAEAFAFLSTLRALSAAFAAANWIRRHEHFYRNRAHQRFISIYTRVPTRVQLFGERTPVCINSLLLINFAPNESPKVWSRVFGFMIWAEIHFNLWFKWIMCYSHFLCDFYFFLPFHIMNLNIFSPLIIFANTNWKLKYFCVFFHNFWSKLNFYWYFTQFIGY